MRIIIIAVIVIILFAGGVWLSNNTNVSEDVISKRGIHWHSQLEIYIKGEKQDIPSGIGLGGIHNPIHTHETDGTIHLEFDELVREDNIRLGEFFKVWGKEFNSEQIFENINGPDGQVQMSVNGEADAEFENYMMQDNDKIEIRYE